MQPVLEPVLDVRIERLGAVALGNRLRTLLELPSSRLMMWSISYSPGSRLVILYSRYTCSLRACGTFRTVFVYPLTQTILGSLVSTSPGLSFRSGRIGADRLYPAARTDPQVTPRTTSAFRTSGNLRMSQASSRSVHQGRSLPAASAWPAIFLE